MPRLRALKCPCGHSPANPGHDCELFTALSSAAGGTGKNFEDRTGQEDREGWRRRSGWVSRRTCFHGFDSWLGCKAMWGEDSRGGGRWWLWKWESSLSERFNRPLITFHNLHSLTHRLAVSHQTHTQGQSLCWWYLFILVSLRSVMAFVHWKVPSQKVFVGSRFKRTGNYNPTRKVGDLRLDLSDLRAQ